MLLRIALCKLIIIVINYGYLLWLFGANYMILVIRILFYPGLGDAQSQVFRIEYATGIRDCNP